MGLNLEMLWRLRASTISMRAFAPFSTLLALVWLLVPCVLVPAGVSGQTAEGPHASHRKAKHPKPVRPRSNVRKAKRQKKHIKLPEAFQAKPPAALASVADRTTDRTTDKATADRVHAWVKSEQEAAPTDPHASATAEEAAVAVPGAAAATALAPAQATAAEPVVMPVLYYRRGRLVVPPPLKGSHEILIHQNLMADSDGLERVRDDADLDHMRSSGMLVPIPASGTLHVDERLPADRRYCRPWTALFLDTLARQHFARFQTALQVNSAVRTVEFQQRLIHSNGNAAPAEGDTASPHLTGQAVDIAKHGLSLAEIAWLRGYLLPLVQQGKVDVEEEFQQSCFHISVYKSYMPQTPPRRIIATTHREGMTSLGMSLR